MIYHNDDQRQTMPKSFKWISTAVLSVLAIVLWSNLVKPSPWLTEVNPSLTETNVLVASVSGTVDTAAEVDLTVEAPKQSATLSYSSQAEIFRFTLEASGPYTLRYLTLNVETQGLKPITNWTLYEVEEGRADFSEAIGKGEKLQDKFLRIRLSSSRSAAYIGKVGESQFVLVGSILKDPTSNQSPSLSIFFPSELPQALDWAWLPGEHSEAWLTITEHLGAKEVRGLPTAILRLE